MSDFVDCVNEGCLALVAEGTRDQDRSELRALAWPTRSKRPDRDLLLLLHADFALFQPGTDFEEAALACAA